MSDIDFDRDYTTAVSGLLFRLPFYASVFLDMKVEVNKDFDSPAGTDGFKRMFMNPEKLIKLYNEGPKKKSFVHAIGYILVHEIMHRVLMHTITVGDRHPVIWNIAADAIIHKYMERDGMKISDVANTRTLDEWAELIEAGLLGKDPKDHGKGGVAYDPTMPKEWDTADAYDYLVSKLSNEAKKELKCQCAIRKLLSYPMKGDGSAGGNAEQENGKMIPYDGDLYKPEVEGATEEDIREAIRSSNTQAMKAHKQRGEGALAFEGDIETAEEASVPWWKYLRKFMRAAASRDDWSYRRISRRFASDPRIVRPGRFSETFGTVVCIIDTSGSMSNQELGQIATEIEKAVVPVKPKEIVVVYADYEVQHVDRFPNGRNLKFKRHGAGGTSFVPAFKWVEQNVNDAEVIILFTDGWGDFPSKEPGIPVFFGVMEGNMNHDYWPRWGKKVEVKID